MIKAIVLIFILFVALALGHNLIGYQGRVVIATESTVIEMTLISAVIIAFFSIIGIWLLKWIGGKLLDLILGSKNWLGSLSKRQQRKAFHNALSAYLIGDHNRAEKHINKTFSGDFKGSNYLLAAKIAESKDSRHKLLSLASAEKESVFAASVMQAASMLSEQPEKSLEILEELPDKQQKHEQVVRLKLQALAQLKRWADLKDLIASNKKLLGKDYIDWAQRATHGEFAEIASKQGANALKEKWMNLSRAARKDVANQICYVQLLIDQGLSGEAEDSLIEFTSKNEHPAFWGLFKQLNHSEPHKAMRFIEKLIKQDPEKAEYYSVLAHLAYNSGDKALALKAINKALELRRNREDAMLMAAILENDKSYDQAISLYKQMLSSDFV